MGVDLDRTFLQPDGSVAKIWSSRDVVMKGRRKGGEVPNLGVASAATRFVGKTQHRAGAHKAHASPRDARPGCVRLCCRRSDLRTRSQTLPPWCVVLRPRRGNAVHALAEAYRVGPVSREERKHRVSEEVRCTSLQPSLAVVMGP